MQLESWKIQGTSFHFGRHGLGQEQTMTTMPSDSLFAALVARLARTRGAQVVDEFCNPFLNGSPPFVLSSTFPFAGDVRFFPVPLSARRGGEQVGIHAKQLKRVKYLSEGAFRSALKGVPLAQMYRPEHLLQHGELLANEDDFKRLPSAQRSAGTSVWEVEQRPRVALDRATSASNLFHLGQIHFIDGCGLWFALRWLDESLVSKDDFSNMLHELAAVGFGADRSVGLGIADVDDMGTFELPDSTGAWVTLSRYLPKKEEISALLDKHSAYKIQSVKGWLDSPSNMGQRRRAVNLLEAGSVIGQKITQDAPGQVVDVQPRYKAEDGKISEPLGHNVYRCGLALAVGIEGGEK